MKIYFFREQLLAKLSNIFTMDHRKMYQLSQAVKGNRKCPFGENFDVN